MSMRHSPSTMVLDNVEEVVADERQRPKDKPKPKRYNLVLPEELFNEIQKLADEKHTTVLDVLRRFIKLGLIAARVEETPDAALIIREGTTEREIILL